MKYSLFIFDFGAVASGFTHIEALTAEKPDQVYYKVNEIYEQNV